MRNIFVFFAILFSHSFFWAEDVRSLLSGYLENDLELQKYVIQAESKLLDLKSTNIEQGINVTLQTGQIQIQTGTSGKKRISVNPKAPVSVPQADLSIGANIPVVLEDGEKTVSDGSLSATVGIITAEKKKRKVALLESNRALLEAERQVKNRALSGEKEFYSSLKSLYSTAISVFDAKEDLFDDSTSLRVLLAQGYSKTSASYRTASLKVESDKRNVQEKQRIFSRQTTIFARKCGISLSLFEKDGGSEEDVEAIFQKALSFLPDSIPKVELENVFNYDEQFYSEKEKALYQKFINELKREYTNSATLSLTGEYKLNDSFYSKTNGTGEKTSSDSAGGQLSFSYRGLSMSAGAFFPLKQRLFGSPVNSNEIDPYFQFSLAFDLGTFRLHSIQKKQDKLSALLDEIAVSSAEDNYETDLTSLVTQAHDVKWAEKSYAWELETYSNLESDMERWFRQGSVTENDLIGARNNAQKARINVLINALEQLIFNDGVRLLFCASEEAKSKK